MIIQPAGEMHVPAPGVVNKTVARCAIHVEAVIQPLHRCAAARAKARAQGFERAKRKVGLVFHCAAVRFARHKIDCTACRALARHQRGRAFEYFNALQIAGIHHARSHVLRADLDAVVERVDLTVGKAAHGKSGRFARRIARRDAHCALRRFSDATQPARFDGGTVNYFNRCRRLAWRQA